MPQNFSCWNPKSWSAADDCIISSKKVNHCQISQEAEVILTFHPGQEVFKHASKDLLVNICLLHLFCRIICYLFCVYEWIARKQAKHRYVILLHCPYIDASFVSFQWAVVSHIFHEIMFFLRQRISLKIWYKKKLHVCTSI